MASTLLDSYGKHKTIAETGSQFIQHLFRCTIAPPYKEGGPHPDLTRFIVYLLHFSGLPSDTVYLALFFLQCLKHRHYLRRRRDWSPLFLPALMLAAKCVNDKEPSNRWWSQAGLNFWTLQRLNKLEREMYLHLDWDLAIDPALLRRLSERIVRDFSSFSIHPCPTYPLSIAPVTAVAEGKAIARENTEATRTLNLVNQVALQRPAYFLLPVSGDSQMLDVKVQSTCAYLYVFTLALPSRW